MHISYTFKETYKHHLNIFKPLKIIIILQSTIWGTEIQIFKLHWSKCMFVYRFSWFDYCVCTQLRMSVCNINKSRTLHMYFARGLLPRPKRQCDCIKTAGEGHSRICPTLSSQIIQSSMFHTAIHFLPMHLGFFSVRECQGRGGGMVHTWILFRPATST